MEINISYISTCGKHLIFWSNSEFTDVCSYVAVPIGLYGFQHYLSILGSLILIPLVIVPAMGGNYVSLLLPFYSYSCYVYDSVSFVLFN